MVIQEYWLKVLRASPSYDIFFLKNIFFSTLKTILQPSGITWNMIQLIFVNSLGWVNTNINFLMITILCVSKNGAQYVYTRMITNFTETNWNTKLLNSICKLLSCWWYNLWCVIYGKLRTYIGNRMRLATSNRPFHNVITIGVFRRLNSLKSHFK